MGKDLVIIAWGDSIVYGWHDNEYGGWVNRLKIKLYNRKKQVLFLIWEYQVRNL